MARLVPHLEARGYPLGTGGTDWGGRVPRAARGTGAKAHHPRKLLPSSVVT